MNKPVDELIKAVVHEFYGDIRVNSSHYADMFMSQKLCHIKQLPEYFCTMQSLLYKVPDPRNSAYLRKYLSSMPGKVPELVRDKTRRLRNRHRRSFSCRIARTNCHCLQKECIRRKTAKSLKNI
jgi:hypothetical protein